MDLQADASDPFGEEFAPDLSGYDTQGGVFGGLGAAPSAASSPELDPLPPSVVATSPPTWTAPPPAPPAALSVPHMAALSLLVTAALAGVGLGQYGLMGGVGGVALGGALSNAVRAMRLRASPAPALRDEAVWSGGMAVVGFALAGYVAWHIREERK